MKKVDELRPGMEFPNVGAKANANVKTHAKDTLGDEKPKLGAFTENGAMNGNTDKAKDKTKDALFGASGTIYGTEPKMQAGFTLDDTDSGVLRDLNSDEELGGASSLESYEGDFCSDEDSIASSGLGWLFWTLLGVVLIGGLQAWLFISSLWQSNPIAGISGLVVSTIIIVWLLSVMWRDLRAVMFFKRTDANRKECAYILTNGTGQEAFAATASMAKVSGIYGSSEWERFADSVQEHYDAKSVFSLYDRMILRAQDEAARRIIVRSAADTAVVVALSPLAWFDMLAALFRTVRMVRRISEVYGMRLGFAGRIRLYRRVLKNLIFIGASELLTDAAADWLGAGFAGRLSAQLGQGVAAAIYSCRLGYLTVKELRPLEPNQEVLSLSILRRDVLANNGFKRLWINSVKAK